MIAPIGRAVVLAVAVATLACDAGDALLGGARHFDELDPAAAAATVEGAWLIQVRSPDAGDPRAPGADVVTPDQPLPDRARAGDRPILVIAHDDPAARRFASRLVRGGFARVHAVRGGIRAWLDASAGRSD